MSYVAVTDAEVDLGIKYALEQFGWHITRRNLFTVGDHFLMVRYTEQLSFGEALRSTMNHFWLTGDRRERYKAVLGKMLGSRNPLMHKGLVPKRRAKFQGVKIILDPDGTQYRFVT